MEKVEIHFSKGKLLLVILICVGWVMATTYYMFYTEPYSNYLLVKITTILINGFIVYVAGLQVKLLVKNDPVVTLSPEGIDFNNNGKLSTFLWVEIKTLTIEQVRAGNRGKTDILVIKTDVAEKKIPLGSLEKSVQEIREIIGTYWHAPL